MSKIKIIILSFLTVIIVILGATFCIQYDTLRKTKIELERSLVNYKALEQETLSLKENSIAYQETIQGLETSRDSVLKSLNALRKELKIKDREVKELAYIASTASKIDTLYIKDTLFVNNTHIDTLIIDKWYSLNIGLHFPNTIIVNPTFESKKSIIVYTRKELLNPDKCFFINWFRKKTEIVEVIVKEENPYITNSNQKFIQIVK